MSNLSGQSSRDFKRCMKAEVKATLDSEFEELSKWAKDNAKCEISSYEIVFLRKHKGKLEYVTIGDNMKVKFQGVRKKYKYRLESAKKLLLESIIPPIQ